MSKRPRRNHATGIQGKSGVGCPQRRPGKMLFPDAAMPSSGSEPIRHILHSIAGKCKRVKHATHCRQISTSCAPSTPLRPPNAGRYSSRVRDQGLISSTGCQNQNCGRAVFIIRSMHFQAVLTCNPEPSGTCQVLLQI